MENKQQMWVLGQKAARYSKPPSDYFPELFDEWTKYQFDGCVAYFVNVIESALTEREPVGDPKKHKTRQKYTLEDLLEDDFRMPRPPTKLQKRVQGAMNLLQMAADPKSGIKMWRELPKEEVG